MLPLFYIPQGVVTTIGPHYNRLFEEGRKKGRVAGGGWEGEAGSACMSADALA